MQVDIDRKNTSMYFLLSTLSCPSIKALFNTKLPKPLARHPTILAAAHLPHQPKPISSICEDFSNNTRHTTRLVESYHKHERLRNLLVRISANGSDPAKILAQDGDWSNDEFWPVVKFLVNDNRANQVLQVFKCWTSIEESRLNGYNYDKIIKLLGAENYIKEAELAFHEMKGVNLRPCLGIYNLLIHGFARDGKFDKSLVFLSEVKDLNLGPHTSTYNGLIQAYGRYKMYDEMGMCLKEMQLEGCEPDANTYNVLIQEFAQGGLLKKMEQTYHKVMSKRMDLRPSTLFAMLDAYAKYGIMDKMERVYRRLLSLNIPLKEDLTRKLGGVYIEHHMFSRLGDLGIDLSMGSGKTSLAWCLRLLSNACLLSRKGLDSIVEEMDEERASWNVTVANIILFAYLKMKDFTHLRILLSELPARGVKPDMVTLGILFDAISIGFDGSGILKTWKRLGFLYRTAEVETDPLVLAAFGKCHFISLCEELFMLEPETRETKEWTYFNLIDLVCKYEKQ